MSDPGPSSPPTKPASGRRRTFIALVAAGLSLAAITVALIAAGETEPSARVFDVAAGDRRYWAPVAAELVSWGHRVINVDAHGFGESPAGGRFTMADIAEDVAAVNPDLVVRDQNSEIYTVRYDAVNAMLLNEFLKAHRIMEAQQNRIDNLNARLEQQAAQIQKVSAQFELSKSAPKTVLNNQ